MGIAYSTVGDHEGTKAKIQNAYKVKDHFEVYYKIFNCGIRYNNVCRELFSLMHEILL